MKKILFLFVVLLGVIFFSVENAFAASCNFGGDVAGSLYSCFSNSTVVNPAGDLNVQSGFKGVVLKWIKVIGSILGILAVGSIVYGSFLLVVSQGEEEKATKAKEIIKWSLIGFIALITASALIAVVVNVFYGL